jgi:alpha-galactosidase
MLVIGLYGAKGPSADLGGTGCTDIEYQSQMSLWSMMSAPLIATNDLTAMNDATRRILLNKEVIAINQDAAGKQAARIESNDAWEVFLKPLQNGDMAIAVLNKSESVQDFNLSLAALKVEGLYEIRDVWEHAVVGKKNKWSGKVQPHETKLFRLIKK